MDIIKDFKEVCLDKLTTTEGRELEIMANLTTPSQLDAVIMGNVYGPYGLRSRYYIAQMNALLRATVSQGGNGRAGIIEIGKAQDINFGGSSLGGQP